jgi:agmatinase
LALSRKNIADLKQGDIGIIGLPFDKNSSFLQGAAKAPELIIDAIESDSSNYFTENLTDLNDHSKVNWCGNQSADEYLGLGSAITKIIDKGAIPFTLGGDHSITFPVVKALAEKHPDLTILHFDAHCDLYDELGGNKYSHACPFARIMESESATNLTQVGIRTLNTAQKEQADRFGVNIIQMKDWTPAVKFEFDGPVYISFDMDVLDPAFAPGVSHHEPGGFSTREALTMIQSFDFNIVGCDVVEYNPDQDVNGVTAFVTAKIVKELLAKMVQLTILGLPTF